MCVKKKSPRLRHTLSFCEHDKCFVCTLLSFLLSFGHEWCCSIYGICRGVTMWLNFTRLWCRNQSLPLRWCCIWSSKCCGRTIWLVRCLFYRGPQMNSQGVEVRIKPIGSAWWKQWTKRENRKISLQRPSTPLMFVCFHIEPFVCLSAHYLWFSQTPRCVMQCNSYFANKRESQLNLVNRSCIKGWEPLKSNPIEHIYMQLFDGALLFHPRTTKNIIK